MIATIAGRERPDQWVIRGNHHDAWVNGADDPISGMVALLEEARAVGELAKRGWRPKRTIVYAAWDGEEPGLLGSTEWVETHADELRQKAVAYINTRQQRPRLPRRRRIAQPGDGSSTRSRATSPIRETSVSVRERLRAHCAIVRAAPDDDAREARDRGDLRLEALGSGSDYTPFLQHLGIASLNIGFGGEDAGGSYHSIYDSIRRTTSASATRASRMVLRWRRRSGGVARCGWRKRTCCRIEFATPLAETVEPLRRRRWRSWPRQSARDRRAEPPDPRALLAAGRGSRPRLSSRPRRSPVPRILNFAPLQNASRAADELPPTTFDAAVADAENQPRLGSADAAGRLDAALQTPEPSLTRRGPAAPPVVRHQIYAPGFYTGYGVKTLPGVREAIEQHAWPEAEAQAVQAANAITRAASVLDQATAIVTGE